MRQLGDGAWLRYEPAFLAAGEAADLYDRLREDVPWQSREVVVFGRRVLQPRLVHWVADFPYTYSGLTLPASPWPAALRSLRERLEARVPGAAFDGVLLNFYRDGRDSMGLHADAEPELIPDAEIASVSLGATRTFRLERRGDRERIDMPLGPGSLLLMGGTTQRHWRHALPRSAREQDGRINLTFRQHRSAG